MLSRTFRHMFPVRDMTNDKQMTVADLMIIYVEEVNVQIHLFLCIFFFFKYARK